MRGNRPTVDSRLLLVLVGGPVRKQALIAAVICDWYLPREIILALNRGHFELAHLFLVYFVDVFLVFDCWRLHAELLIDQLFVLELGRRGLFYPRIRI